jgi:hypothetical protein
MLSLSIKTIHQVRAGASDKLSANGDPRREGSVSTTAVTALITLLGPLAARVAI